MTGECGAQDMGGSTLGGVMGPSYTLERHLGLYWLGTGREVKSRGVLEKKTQKSQGLTFLQADGKVAACRMYFHFDEDSAGFHLIAEHMNAFCAQTCS